MKKFLLKKYNRFIILIWIAIGIIFWIQFSRGATVIEAGLLALCFILSTYPFTSYLSNTLLLKAMKRKNMFVFTLHFFLFTALSAGIICVFLRLFAYLESVDFFPASLVLAGDDSILDDFFSMTITVSFINLAFCGLRFYEKHNELEKIHLETQLHALQSQINPHFMFNILNHVHYYVEKKDDLASILLLKYSEILRYQLYSVKKDTVFLDEEIQFLKNFIDIEKIRWEDKLNINCSWEIDNDKTQLPSLLLIPLIENAFKHVSRSSKGKGYINICFKQDAKNIRLEVGNSKLILPEDKKKHSGFGLENLKKRLDILFHEKYELTIQESETVFNAILILYM